MKLIYNLFVILSVMSWISCEKSSLKNNSSTYNLSAVGITPSRTVILGTGPETYVRPSTIPKLKRFFVRDFPNNSDFKVIERFSLRQLPKLNITPFSKVHLILNAHGKVEQGEHMIYTEDGWLKTKELGKKLQELYLDQNSVSIETSLITCHAGATDCSFFPGGVFGASSDETVAYEYTFFHFIKGLNDNLYRFPMSSSEMFQGYNIAARSFQKKSDGFAKPLKVWRQNCNGILGIKIEKSIAENSRSLLDQSQAIVTQTCFPLPLSVPVSSRCR